MRYITAFTAFALMFPSAVLAQDTQADHAAQIEQLAYNHPATPPVRTPTRTFDLYPDPTAIGSTLYVSDCTARLETIQYSNAYAPYPSLIVIVDLVTATLIIRPDGKSYSFTRYVDAAHVPTPHVTLGGIAFQAPTGETYPQTRRILDPNAPTLNTAPSAMIDEVEHLSLVNYIMRDDVTEQRMADLAASLQSYIFTYCQPIS